MQQNNFNSLSRYEDLFSDFSNLLSEYLSVKDGQSIREFNLKQAKKGPKTRMKNSLIEDDFTSNELVEKIKSSYLSRDYLKGEIGTIDGNEQYNGIFNIALYMLISNRLGKYYKGELDNNSSLDENTKIIYKEKYKNLMAKKDNAITKLIYSLFIYKETENDNKFYYGYKYSYEKGKIGDTLIIDLPTYGQISVHFGSKKKLETIKYLAKQNIDLILAKKLQLGQITDEQFDTIGAKANTDKILPKYTGKQYEFLSGIPLDYCGKKFDTAQDTLGLSKKLSTEITDEDIENMSKTTNYNTRELYYFAIKKDFSKSQLEKLEYFLEKRKRERAESRKSENLHKQKSINTNSILKKIIPLTTADERQQVATHEAILDKIHLDIAKEK